MRMIAAIRISNLCLPNIEIPVSSNPRLDEAILMPEFKTSLEGDWMFRNHKELVDFWKVRNLFEELSSLDNDVDCSLRQIANFLFNIKCPNLSTKLFMISTKLSQTLPSRI